MLYLRDVGDHHIFELRLVFIEVFLQVFTLVFGANGSSDSVALFEQDLQNPDGDESISA